MTTSQQLMFLEAISGIKKAQKRKAYESDSDESIDHNGNRGQKLKKRARFTRQGQLAPPSGPQAYKEEIEYAGASRSILNRNPPLLDEDGYELDSEDDDERVQDAMASAAPLNPYAGIRLEHILAPLTSVSELATHQTLSVPYTSTILTDLANQGAELARKENQSLWKVKHLLTGLCGDYIWSPCGLMLGPNDAAVYAEDYMLRLAQQRASREVDGSSPGTLDGDARIESRREASNEGSHSSQAGAANGTNGHLDGADVDMVDAGKGQTPQKADTGKPSEGGVRNGKGQAEEDKEASRPDANDKPDNGDAAEAPQKVSTPTVEREQERTNPATETTKPADENVKMADADQTSSAAQPARPNGTGHAPVGPLDESSEFFIHPFFDIPPNARPDKDMGLPENEADNVRHLVALYVQKQEEICRGAKRLHEGLLKADRMRKAVIKWAKAEAHCGSNRDMSDGEDWYDWEEWGLDEDLKKGADEEEEENTATTTKKTRNRK